MTPDDMAATSSAEPTLSEEEQAEVDAADQAEPLIEDFIRMNTNASADPDDFNRGDFEDVAISTAQRDLENRLESLRNFGNTNEGREEVISISQPEFFDLDNPDEPAVVEYLVCTDISDITNFDADGVDITPEERADRVLKKYGIANYEYPDETQWRVAYAEWQEGESC
ncbi:hypothetical protein [Ornithinimicrobium sp. INDO-MA30-4]|uniref:hypothetical protein n=1 Tax=Ornithinimicrobium sp. INDO-MA30-4 TaxID=2908651 RepID=UPI001F2CBBAB|nr:hypothetical protein [Ornithinimicrobium sp. INDO-MA30-4]UJH71781.1 hypothetical protein L0A91_16995 [Ornithinimicrobium sp. INDO-MA30-4]